MIVLLYFPSLNKGAGDKDIKQKKINLKKNLSKTLELHIFQLLCSIKLVYSLKEIYLCVHSYDIKMLPRYKHIQVPQSCVWGSQNI